MTTISFKNFYKFKKFNFYKSSKNITKIIIKNFIILKNYFINLNKLFLLNV